MRVISFEEIQKLNILPETCMELVSDMIANKKLTQLPPKISLHPMDGSFCNIMPCIIPDKKYKSIGGVKIVNRYPDRVPSLDSTLLLLDMQTGEFLAFMDANWITAMRTGTVCAHSVKLFAKKQFSAIAMMGLGNTARASLLMLVHEFPTREFTVKLLRYKDQELQFSKRFSEYNNLHFVYVDNYESLIKGSEVIISCVTYFAEDICKDEWVDEGTLIVPVHTRGFSNCDLFFDKVYADDYNHVCHFKNFQQFKSFAEVCDVVNGIAEGRKNEQERILAYNIGLAIHDINFAGRIYTMMDTSGLLEKMPCIDLKSPTDKFWI